MTRLQMPQLPTAGIRDVGDIPATRQAVFNNVLDELGRFEPVTNQRYGLHLTNVGYEGADKYTKEDEKRALIEGRTLGRRVRGTWQLRSPDGAVVDQNRLTLANVPYLSSRGTFIINGSDYGMAHQSRLRPGIFTRQKESGELESHVNVAKGYGHRYFLDPESGVFRIQFGQSRVPLLPIMRALGVTDSQLRKQWGNEIYYANMKAHDPGAVKKVYQKLKRSDHAPSDVNEMTAALKQAFEEMTLDPEVTQRTLGQPFERVTLDTVLAATSKLLRVQRGEEAVDDRDAMAFQKLLGPEDIFAERVRKARAEANKMLWKATFAGNLRKAPTGVFSKMVRGALLDTGLGNLLEEVNPSEVLDQMYRATRMGEGGIGSLDAVPMDSRNVQPSHLGFIDIIHTPESAKIGVDTRIAVNTRKGSDGRIYSKFSNAKTGKVEWKSPQDLADLTVSFPGELESDEKHVRGMVAGKLQYVPRDKVDYQLTQMTEAFGPLANLVPMKSAAFPQRASMGSRMTTQALPLVDGEAPFVQSGIPGEDRSFEELYGDRMGAVRSEVAGTVVDVQPSFVTIKGSDGKSHTVELFDNLPFNRKTFMHNKPVVQLGQQVKVGGLIATSNYTNAQGVTALGRNVRVAYLPYKGYDYEDAVVGSESFVKKMTSEHLYQNDLERTADVETGLNKFMSIFPGKYKRDILAKFDEDGIIKPGTEVEYDEPLILAVRQRKTGPRLGRRKRSFVDDTVKWEHHATGTVTDVFKGKKGINVVVKAMQPSQVGDKFAGRYGDKNILAAVIPDEDMPQDEQGRPFELLLSPLGVISRGNPAQILETALGKIAAITGKPIKVPDFQNSGKLRDWVEQQLVNHGISDMEKVFDPGENRKIPNVLAGNRFIMKLHHMAECYDAETEVLTAKGWVPWPEVRDHDVFATVENGQIIYEMAEEIIRKPYAGELCTFAGRYVDYAVTPNHRMYLERYHGNKGFHFLSAEYVHGSRFKVQQFGFTPDEGEVRNTKQFGSLEIPWEDLCELVGWWISEGSTTLTSRTALAVIYQSETANPTHCQTIRQLFERLPFKWHEYRVAGELFGFATNNRDLVEYLHSYGTHCYNKRLPREILDGPVAGRRRTYDAMMAGDGNNRETATGHGERYSTTSAGLADDFQELTIRIGLGAVSRPDKPRKELHYLPSWTCGVALTRQTAQVDGDRRKSGFAKLSYSGMVYCATMRTGLLYVRRNGKPMLCGNSKLQGRATGEYSSEEEPSKGGEAGAKRVGMLGLNALLSHGAYDVVQDMNVVRGQQNEDYWRQVMSGYTPPAPRVPLVYTKFINELQAAGINPVRKGTKINIMAMTGKDVDKLTGDRALQNSETVSWKSEKLEPTRGGLFDKRLTGGHSGNRWSHIKLHVPLPNPIMEEPIRRLLGLTEKKFRDVLAGSDDYKGATGPQVIAETLKNINVDREIERARTEIKGGRKTYRDAAVRRLGYLKAAKKLDIHPGEWMLDKVPVLPPMFRPVSLMAGSKTALVADPNYLYKELFDANKALQGLEGQVDDVSEERLNLYDSFKAVTGLGDPIQPALKQKKVRGILKHIMGQSPKFGTIQRKLLGATVDLVGRTVISPNPELDMDQVGLPEDKAWTVYKPFIIRRLVKRGMPHMRALDAVENREKIARHELMDEMKERPVIIDRAPVLHRYGVMAFWPQLTNSKALQIPPLVTSGFGADFDGDQMNFHVPAKDSAVKEAIEKLLPSKNLIAASNFDVHYMPSMEYISGLWAASSRKDLKKPVRKFQTKKDAVRAYRRGEIGIGQRIEVLDH